MSLRADKSKQVIKLDISEAISRSDVNFQSCRERRPEPVEGIAALHVENIIVLEISAREYTELCFCEEGKFKTDWLEINSPTTQSPGKVLTSPHVWRLLAALASILLGRRKPYPTTYFLREFFKRQSVRTTGIASGLI